MASIQKHFGRRLLHQVLDDFAESSPSRLYASIPRSGDVREGFRDITFKDMARCSDQVATTIEEKFGLSKNFETLCYIGIPDLRSAITFIAALKCGYKVFFPSPRNPPSTNASLLEQTKCTKIVYAKEAAPIINMLASVKKDIEQLELPSFHEIFESDATPFLYSRQTFEDAENNPIVILHSSGSTGLPKPVIMTNGSFSILDNERNLPTVSGRRNRDFSVWDFNGGGKFYVVFPYFHLAGFLSTIVNPIFTEQSIPVLGPPLELPGGVLLKEIMQQQDLRALYVPPAVAEQLLQEPEGIDFFKKLDFLCYTGGPFSPSAGEKLSEVTTLCPLYGSTEAFQVPQLAPSREDWAYMEWNPNFKYEMQPSKDEKGTYEMVLFTDETTRRMSALNHNFPDIHEWRTRDLFKPHPTKPNLWQYYGRTDDIIVLSNSEKFNPVPAELKIQGHPSLAGALIIGKGRFQAALLIEPKLSLSETEKASLVDAVWPTVEKANLLMPGQGHILRSKILVTSPNKPFSRAGKGTVIRKLTEQSYSKDIDRLYSEGYTNSLTTIPILKAPFEFDSVAAFVRAIILSCFPAYKEAPSDTEDFFGYGLDSLKSNEIVASLKTSLKQHAGSSDLSWISLKLIYQRPTASQLSKVVYAFLDRGIIPSEADSRTRVVSMETLAMNYTKSLPLSSSEDRPAPASLTVALTGSTGSLGSFIVRCLLQHPKVKRIICLNRGADAQERQEIGLRKAGISIPEFSKINYLKVDLGKLNFGLPATDYDALLCNVDIILHNAWPVNFNMSLASFERHIQGVRNLIEWSAKSPSSIPILFVSSVSSSSNNPINNGGKHSKIREQVTQDYSTAFPMGYAESKRVAENILSISNSKSEIPISIIRVGQIAGSSSPNDSRWPEREWVFPLIKASKFLGKIPANVAPIDWVPIDKVAESIVEILTADKTFGRDLQVYNVVNLNPVPWTILVDTLLDDFGLQAKPILLAEWTRCLRAIERNAEKDSLVESALTLLDYFEMLGDGSEHVEYETQKCTEVSRTMATLGPITKDLLKIWLEQWSL